MKIGFVFDDSLDSLTAGVQTYMVALADYYVAQGHEIHWLVGETKRTDMPNVHSMSRNLKVQFNGNRLTIPLWAPKKRVREVLQRENFDVLHVQVPYHPLMAGRIIKAAGPQTTVFGTFHIAPYSRLVTIGSYLLGLWSRPTLRRFDAMVSVSLEAQRLSKQTYGVDTDVVPNVFDYRRFHAAKPRPEYDDDIKTIVYLGRLVPRKGVQVLLEAVAQLPKNTPFRVVVCGAGPLEAKLKEFVAEQELESVVEFAGRISEEDKPSYFASADIAVFPSSGGESFGIVLIEAMASGRAAVLGGDNPGYRTVLGKKPDLLFSPKNAHALASRLRQLLTDEPSRQAAADWGRQDSAQYDVQIVGAKLLDLYKKVAPNNNKEA